MNYINKEESKFVLYPYPFKYKDQNKEEKEVNYGGYFAMNQTLFNGDKI